MPLAQKGAFKKQRFFKIILFFIYFLCIQEFVKKQKERFQDWFIPRSLIKQEEQQDYFLSTIFMCFALEVHY
jgi:hypothetical protein